MDTQVNTVVNTESIAKRTTSWLELILKIGGVLAFLITGIIFLNNVYNLINANKNKIDEQGLRINSLEHELREKVDKHDFSDLGEKVTRQYSIFNERMLKDVDPMKTWIDFHKGWLEGSQLKK